MKRLVKLLAIPLSCQKALHSHPAKPPKYGDISRWLTATKWLVMMEPLEIRHSREGGNPAVLFNMPLGFVFAVQEGCFGWIPAFAGMAKFEFLEDP